MRDRSTELSESQRFRFGLVRLPRCGVCRAIMRTQCRARAQLSPAVFVDVCGSHYCYARAVVALEELRDRVAPIVAMSPVMATFRHSFTVPKGEA